MIRYLMPRLPGLDLQKLSVTLWSWQIYLPMPFCITFFTKAFGIALFDIVAVFVFCSSILTQEVLVIALSEGTFTLSSFPELTTRQSTKGRDERSFSTNCLGYFVTWMGIQAMRIQMLHQMTHSV